MLQFYFLSIVLNSLAGYILVSKDENGGLEFKSGFTLKDETFRFIVGIATAITGLLKILSAVEGDVRVIGDLVPAIAGLLAGFILVFEHYRNRLSESEPEHSEKIDKFLIANKKIIGMIAITAAVLHFLFPKVLLL